MKSFKFLLFIGLFLLIAKAELKSQNLAVKNVQFVQQKDSRVVVYYDLIGNPKNKHTVKLTLYRTDSQKKVTLEGITVAGEVGEGIHPGERKKIIWDLLEDYPNGLDGENFVFTVDAYKQKGARKWPWFVVGLTAIGGGAAYYLLSSPPGTPTPSGSTVLAVPPAFP